MRTWWLVGEDHDRRNSMINRYRKYKVVLVGSYTLHYYYNQILDITCPLTLWLLAK